MKRLTLKLDKNCQRPVVLLSTERPALLDTGAYIPAWTDVLVVNLGDFRDISKK